MKAGMNTMPMAIIARSSPAPNTAAIVNASTRKGKESMASVIRIKRSSSRPR